MAILRAMPNMRVVMPADYTAAIALMKEAVAAKGPVYLRFTRDAVPVIYEKGETFSLGKAKMIRRGRDLYILAIGDMVCQALNAANLLEAEGVDAGVVDVHTLKPLDCEIVAQCIRETGKIVTVEDHNLLGGLGSAVCEVVAEMGAGRVSRVGIPDTFAESGPYGKLLEKYGLDSSAIAKKAKILAEK